jgi:hypothetical protein
VHTFLHTFFGLYNAKRPEWGARRCRDLALARFVRALRSYDEPGLAVRERLVAGYSTNGFWGWLSLQRAVSA